MKTFLVLAVVAVLISGLNARAHNGDSKWGKVGEAFKTCGQQNNISRSEMDAAFKSHFVNVSSKFNCLSDCVGNQLGTIKNGAIVDSEMLKGLQDMKMNQTAAQNALNTCKPKYAGANNCEKAKNFWACMTPLLPQHSHGSDKHGSDKHGKAKSFKNVQSVGAKSENADKKNGKKHEKSEKHGKGHSTTPKTRN